MQKVYRQITNKEADYDECKKLFQEYKHLGEDQKFIVKAFTKFHHLQSVPRMSELRTVGYFSVIEGLVTHKPVLHESLDSISSQLQGKLVLLMRRIGDLKPQPKSFNKLTEKNLWKKSRRQE